MGNIYIYTCRSDKKFVFLNCVNTACCIFAVFLVSHFDIRNSLAVFSQNIFFCFKSFTCEKFIWWLAHLARHAPPNRRVKYVVGSSPTGSIIRNWYPKLRIKNVVYVRSKCTRIVDRILVGSRTRSVIQHCRWEAVV